MTQALLQTSSSDAELTERLLAPTWSPLDRRWAISFGVTGLGTLVLFACITYTVLGGIGLWGNQIPVAWAFGIINFVWWVGIAHAGTFISAILFLFEQPWRTSINRFAEAMTLFAVVQAGLFPLLHLGRPWFAYWLFPYPSTIGVWPQLKSALPWDAAAISTYITVSFLFWYLGLVPDLAAVRDSAPTRRRRFIYGIFAMGWRGSARHFRHYRVGYALLAGLAAPLVISVHSVVSSDFAITLLPGWHSTIFPPFFVAGAIYNGFAMVLTLLIPARIFFGLHDVVTEKHLDNMAKMLLVTGLFLCYAYAVEFFIAWYSGDEYERYQYFVLRPGGPGSSVFWLMILGNVVVPQFLWARRFRTSPAFLFVASLLINVGMWAERFVIIVLGLQRDFLPSSFATYRPTWVDIGILGGTMAFFLFLFLLFLKFVPFIPVTELKEMRRQAEAGGAQDA